MRSFQVCHAKIKFSKDSKSTLLKVVGLEVGGCDLKSFAAHNVFLCYLQHITRFKVIYYILHILMLFTT